MEPKKPFHETVAEKLIEQIKVGTAPWQKPWQAGEAGTVMPFNPTTGNRYKGINAIHLMSQGRDDQRWMTYKQASAVDAQVRKGEKGTPIQYWKFSDEQTKLDANGNPVLDAKGEPIKQNVQLERPRVFIATVFNAEQIDGLPPLQARKQQEWNSAERAEQILQASGAVIKHGEQDRAFYRPSSDSIHLPDKGLFPTANNYYATALHELGHWTGHESRLDRDMVHPFGSQGYAKEELRAEIASMILGDELGIGHDPGQHVAYVASWVKALEEDPLEIFRAAADAEKIQNYVLTLEQRQIQAIPNQQSQLESDQDRPQDRVESVQGVNMANVPNIEPSKGNDHVQAAELARLAEERIRLDPNSTDEDIAAAKEARKDAEFNATLNDTDLQRRIAEIDREQKQGVGTSPAAPASTAAQQAHPVSQAAQMPEEIRNEQLSHGVKTFIKVPFKQKDEAKSLGAKWDKPAQSWYVPPGVEIGRFSKWTGGHDKGSSEALRPSGVPEGLGSVHKPAKEIVFLSVPYAERIEAKAAGAQWDKPAKSWYAGPNADMAKLDKWVAEKVPGQQSPAMTPREEFTDALVSLGLTVDGDHPIMDGKKHRIAALGDKKGERSGFYVGHLDGHPAGHISNNKTGDTLKWKSKGYALDPEQKAQMQAVAAAKLHAREIEQNKAHELTAQRVGQQMVDLKPATQPTAYMQAKGVRPQAGVMTDQVGQKTYIPATDTDGKQWTMQYIQEDGTKRFAKDSRKEGCFHAVGGLEALAKAPALVIGEGYATACSLSQTLGFATVAAFDSGNLLHVAKALHAKYPDKPVVIAGDDDRHLEITQGKNPGRTKAEEAAKAVGGKILLPIFAPGEATYPKELPLITPKSYRDHITATEMLQSAQQDPERVRLTQEQSAELKSVQLNAEQVAALTAMKRHTDFNDLATKSELGQEGIRRQVNSVVEALVEKQQARIEHQQNQRQVQEIAHEKHEEKPRRTVKMG